jgi:hypothetical protein
MSCPHHYNLFRGSNKGSVSSKNPLIITFVSLLPIACPLVVYVGHLVVLHCQRHTTTVYCNFDRPRISNRLYFKAPVFSCMSDQYNPSNKFDWNVVCIDLWMKEHEKMNKWECNLALLSRRVPLR